MHARLSSKPNSRVEHENESGKSRRFSRESTRHGRSGCSEKLPGYRKASVGRVEIHMHGLRDTVSVDDLAPHREAFGISNERCGRWSTRSARPIFPTPPCVFLKTVGANHARRHDSLSGMRRTLVIRAPRGDDEVHALATGASSLRLSVPLRPGRQRPCRFSAPSPQAQGMFLLRKVFQVLRYPSTASRLFVRPWKQKTWAFSGYLGCRKSSPGVYSSSCT